MPETAATSALPRKASEIVLVGGDGATGAPAIRLDALARHLTGRPPDGSGVGSQVWRAAPRAVAEGRKEQPGDRIVALKQVNLTDDTRQRLLPQERTWLDRLSSPFFPRALADGMLDARTYLLLTDWIDGPNLALHGPAAVADLVAADRFEGFCADLIRIYTLLQDKGIEHGDIWEPNIMVHHHRPVLIDFGWARAAGTPPPRDNLHQPDDREAVRQMLLRLGALRRMVAPGVPFDMERLKRA